ncbi:unnamed protein product [Gordionus sp. m RMFG-2023]
MLPEVDSTILFLSDLLARKFPLLSPSSLHYFANSLRSTLTRHYKNHWFPETPLKGSGYRCIRINGLLDPVVAKAADMAGLARDCVRIAFPDELTLWVDPGGVFYRIGENGSVGRIYPASPHNNNHINSSFNKNGFNVFNAYSCRTDYHNYGYNNNLDDPDANFNHYNSDGSSGYSTTNPYTDNSSSSSYSNNGNISDTCSSNSYGSDTDLNSGNLTNKTLTENNPYSNRSLNSADSINSTISSKTGPALINFSAQSSINAAPLSKFYNHARKGRETTHNTTSQGRFNPGSANPLPFSYNDSIKRLMPTAALIAQS